MDSKLNFNNQIKTFSKSARIKSFFKGMNWHRELNVEHGNENKESGREWQNMRDLNTGDF